MEPITIIHVSTPKTLNPSFSRILAVLRDWKMAVPHTPRSNMTSASSSAARLLIRGGKSATSLLLRGRTVNLTETVQNTGPAIRSLLRFNQTPAIQYPVFSETFPVMQSGFRVGFIQQEAVSERRGKMEAGHGKRVVDNESGDSEEETDLDEEEFDDMDDDEEFDDSDVDDDDDDDDDDEDDDKYTRKKKK